MLHADYIVEYVDASLIPSTEGYETTTDDLFAKDLAKNPARHEEHLRWVKEQEASANAARDAAALHQKKQDKEFEREFARFKAWQKSQRT